jgi:hypothetical protein
MVLNLIWSKCENEQWCRLNSLNLNDKHFELMAGIYIIWRQSGATPLVLRVGQGFIKQRLHQHRWEADIMALSNDVVFVTWAALDAAQRDGAARFLADKLDPAVKSDRQTTGRPLKINLPW